MTDTSEPHWERLPHDPEGFFELQPGYDRKDLKRCYNRLIRRYKPEKLPQEFQTIRAAYEDLDNQLRYGQRIEAPNGLNLAGYDWAAETVPAETVPAEPMTTPSDRRPQGRRPQAEHSSSAPPRPPSFIERLRSEPPDALYAELARRKSKTPYDYFALALLSDAVAGDDPLRFAKWVLSGLKAHPDEPGLMHLLYAWFRAGVEPKIVPKLLKAVSKVVGGDRFYFLTERLWVTLLDEAPFAVFRQTLAECEANLRDHRIAGKLTFYLYMIRRALFRADARWLRDAFALLEEHYQEVPPHLEYDLELTFWLREYRQSRGEFLNGEPVRSEMDAALVAFCERDELDSDRVILECQLWMASDAQAVLDAFPLDGRRQPIALPWEWLSHEAAARAGEPEVQLDVEEVFHKTYGLLEQIESVTERSSVGSLWMLLGWGYLAASVTGFLMCGLVPVVLFFLLAMLFGRASGLSGLILLLGIGASVAGLVGYVVWLKERTVVRARDHLAYRLAARSYRTLWRHEVLQFLQLTHYPSGTVQQVMEHLVQSGDTDHLTYHFWVTHFAQQDYGLTFYSTAQRFLR